MNKTILSTAIILILCLSASLKSSANYIDKSFSRDITSIVIDVRVRTYIEPYSIKTLDKANPLKLMSDMKREAQFPFPKEDIQSWALKTINNEPEITKKIRALAAQPEKFQTYIEGRDQDKIYVLIEAVLFPSTSTTPPLSHDVIVLSIKKKRILLTNQGGKIGMVKKRRDISHGPFLFSTGTVEEETKENLEAFINRHVFNSIVAPIIN